MTKVILFGYNGHMGKEVQKAVENALDMEIVCGVDKEINASDSTTQVTDINEFQGEADVIIDFSHHSCVKSILSYAKDKLLPVVICTTGFTEEEHTAISKVSKVIPIFLSANMSLGINLTSLICQIATKVLQGYDIEIVEKHHNRKLDAPSGTALLLADSIKQANPSLYSIYDRSNIRSARNPNEIGIQSVRGGNLSGEHEVMFLGEDEVVSIKHTANSRSVFAKGAVKASAYIVGKPAGIYSMQNMIAEE